MKTRRGRRRLSAKKVGLALAIVLLAAWMSFEAAPEANAQASPGPSEADFSLRQLGTNLEQPMAMQADSAGNIFVVGRCGRLYVWSPTTQAIQQTSTLDVRCDYELGLLGITLDPDFDENRWAYLQYNPNGQSVQRVSRFVMNPNNTLDIGSESVLLEFDVQSQVCCHQGGDLEFGPNGNLFIGVGDNVNPFESDGYTPIDETPARAFYDSQGTSGNTNDLRGKILRITPLDDGTYAIPAGNLFDGDALRRPEIYVMGARNPFRMTVDQETGYLYWGEVGPDANSANPNRGPAGLDEVNETREAGNYGWPYASGFNEAYSDYDFATNTSGALFDINGPTNDSPNNTGARLLPPTEPAWITYPHQATMSGPVYHYDATGNANRLPSYFDQRLIFWDFNTGDIYSANADGNASNPDASVFFDNLTDGRSLIDIKLDDKDRLLVLGYDSTFNGELSRIEFNDSQDGNRPPEVVAEATAVSGSLPLEVTFFAAGTSDPDGDTLTYSWDFTTDGVVDSDAETATYVYQQRGTYNAQLRVSDSAGNEVVTNIEILAGLSAPEVTLTSPATGSFFAYGDDLAWQVNVQDDAATPDCADITVELVLAHVTGTTEHSHGLDAATGCSGSFPTGADGGHDGEQIYLKLTASYTNSDGIKGTAVVELQPRLREAEHWTAQNGLEEEIAADTGNGTSAAFIESGDWLMFRDMDLGNVGAINVRAASDSDGGTIEARVGSPTGQVVGSLAVANTTGWQEWRTLTMALDPVAQGLGLNDLYLTFTGGGGFLFNLNWFDFLGEAPSPVSPTPPTPGPTPPTPPGGSERVEAESYVAQVGILNEDTTDVGGGQNVAFIESGDSTDYLVDVDATDTYAIAFRVASASDGGTISLTKDGAVITSVTVPNTTGWQEWVTVETSARLDAGQHTYRLEYSGGGGFLFNLNWFELTKQDSTDPTPPTPGPTPPSGASVLWSESFTAANGVTSDSDATSWTAVRASGNFDVQNNALAVSDDGEPGVLTTDVINISGQTVDVSLDLFSEGKLEVNQDYVQLYARVDGGPEELIGERRGNQPNATTISSGAITGQTLQLVVRTYVSYSTEYYYLDNLSVRTAR